MAEGDCVVVGTVVIDGLFDLYVDDDGKLKLRTKTDTDAVSFVRFVGHGEPVDEDTRKAVESSTIYALLTAILEKYEEKARSNIEHFDGALSEPSKGKLPN